MTKQIHWFFCIWWRAIWKKKKETVAHSSWIYCLIFLSFYLFIFSTCHRSSPLFLFRSDGLVRRGTKRRCEPAGHFVLSVINCRVQGWPGSTYPSGSNLVELWSLLKSLPWTDIVCFYPAEDLGLFFSLRHKNPIGLNLLKTLTLRSFFYYYYFYYILSTLFILIALFRQALS